MIRTLYFSTARSQVDRAEVDRIVVHAREKNRRLGVTGALAFNGRNFCQLLEGERDVVLDLMRVIEADPRHAGFKVLDQKEISTAHFPDWSMQLVNDLDFSAVINAMRDD
ncbi:MAG: BLUF domain-containing protein [Pseudomonadota bacterium]